MVTNGLGKWVPSTRHQICSEQVLQLTCNVSHGIWCFFSKSHCLPVLDYVWHSLWFFFFFSLWSRVIEAVLTLMCTWPRWGQHCVIKTSQEAERWVWGHDHSAPSSFWIGKESEKNQNDIEHLFFFLRFYPVFISGNKKGSYLGRAHEPGNLQCSLLQHTQVP